MHTNKYKGVQNYPTMNNLTNQWSIRDREMGVGQR